MACELKGSPDLALIRDAARTEPPRIGRPRLLRRRPTGTDLAKLIALGAKAVVAASKLAFAVGGTIEAMGEKVFGCQGDSETRRKAASLFITPMISEGRRAAPARPTLSTWSRKTCGATASARVW